MANAVCPHCRLWIDWRAGRGSRLAGIRCPVCRGPLRTKKTEEGPPILVRVVGDTVTVRYPWGYPDKALAGKVVDHHRADFPLPDGPPGGA